MVFIAGKICRTDEKQIKFRCTGNVTIRSDLASPFSLETSCIHSVIIDNGCVLNFPTGFLLLVLKLIRRKTLFAYRFLKFKRNLLACALNFTWRYVRYNSCP